MSLFSISLFLMVWNKKTGQAGRVKAVVGVGGIWDWEKGSSGGGVSVPRPQR